MEDTKEQARDAMRCALDRTPGQPEHWNDEIDAILAALAEAGLVIEQDWQPIETAPKDGSSLLLSAGAEAHEGFWDQVDFDPYDMRDPRGMPVMGWNFGAAEIDPSNWRPAYWRHAPTSPSAPSPAPARDAAVPATDQD